MFQISFLNTGLLIFAAATILPLLIWLLARRKPRRVVFSSLRFIKLSKEQDKKRSKLKNIILLIIRMLIILLVALAVARPQIFSSRLAPSRKHPPTAVAIVLDTSFSMDYVHETQTALDRAKAAVRQINALCTPNDAVVLVTSAADWNNMYAQIYAGKFPEDILAGIEITHDPLPVDAMLKLAERRLAESGLINREIYLLSDAQTQGFPKEFGIPVHVIPLDLPGENANLSCFDVKPQAQLVEKSRLQALNYKISNHSRTDRTDVLVRVVLDDVKVAERFVNIPARQTLEQTVTVELRKDGWQSGYVEVVDDRLTHDNRAHFAFPFNMSPRPVVISQRQNLPYFLRSMLQVWSGSGSGYEVLNPANVNLEAIQRYQSVVIYDPGTFGHKLREIVQELRQRERGVLFCLEENAPGDYRQFLESTFGAKLGAFEREQRGISGINKHHYVSSMIADRRSSAGNISDFRQCESTGSSPLLSAGNNALALARDNLILFTFDLGSAKNPFLFSPHFPVLTYRALEYITQSRSTGNSANIGDIVTADAIIMPSGSRVDLPNRGHRVSEPGIYRLLSRDDEDVALAVNHDNGESNGGAADYTGLKYIRQMGKNWVDKVFQSRLGRDIWKILLIMALALFVLEIILVKSEEARPRQEGEERQ